MLRFAIVSSTLRPMIRPLGFLVRDLTPWLVRALLSWLAVRLGGRRSSPCDNCPLLPGNGEHPSPSATPPSGPGITSDRAQVKVRTPLLLLLAMLPLVAATGGCTPGMSYVQADRTTHDAIAPEYANYVDTDPALDDLTRARRHRTLATWRLRLEAAEAQVRP